MSAFLLVLFAILNRVFLASGSHAPHAWWNFTAVGGSLLFFGARRPLRQAWIPVAALIATDYLLTTYMYGYSFHVTSYLITWTWYAAAILLGAALLKRSQDWKHIAGASFASSTLFFLASNFVGLYPVSMYPHNLTGLFASYAAGVPFYRNDLVSTLLVTGVAFGVLAFAKSRETAHGAAAA
jgi:hypothetical protein